jgi:Mlc titration factor MtfA (ptsG expression regulator)
MLFSWLKRRRRKRILAQPFPAEWDAILEAIPHVPILAAQARPELRQAVQIFLAEKTFYGHGDLMVTDAMRVTVAGLASLMTLGMPGFYFDHVNSIILHASIITAPRRTPIAPEAVIEEEIEELGDAWYRGPVRLLWPEIQEDLRQPWHGNNLVIHEFAHQLDMMNGTADGVPVLADELRAPWEKVMHREYRRLIKASRRRRETLIDPYGAEAPEEFFAVTSEAFFDAPLDLRAEHRELYELFAKYYRQDPAARCDEWEAATPRG